MWFFSSVASDKRESFRLCKLHKTKGFHSLKLTRALRPNLGTCMYSPLLLLYYNKLHQKNQDVFFKIVLTAQFCFYIIYLVNLKEQQASVCLRGESFRAGMRF